MSTPEGPSTSPVRLVHPKARRGVEATFPASTREMEHETVEEAQLQEFEDSRRFGRRFGFVWPLADRRRLLYFQADFRLTDGELRRLHAAGGIQPQATGLEIRAKRWEAILGWAHIAALAIVFVPLLTLGLLAYGFHRSATAWLGLGLVVLSVSALGTAYFYFYVAPWRLNRRVQRQRD